MYAALFKLKNECKLSLYTCNYYESGTLYSAMRGAAKLVIWCQVRLQVHSLSIRPSLGDEKPYTEANRYRKTNQSCQTFVDKK